MLTVPTHDISFITMLEKREQAGGPDGVISTPPPEQFLFLHLFPSQGFKWFGSLTNLSLRRSSDKSDSKSKSGAGARGGGGGVTMAPVVEMTVDDMEAMRPRTSSYVRSSENYTHMGTLPRLLMRRRDKSTKGKEASLRHKLLTTYLHADEESCEAPEMF